MAPPKRRFAKPVTSRRYLALRRGRNGEIKALGDPQNDLPVGYKQLYSYYVPGLSGGKHKIHIKQSISIEPRNEEDESPPDLSPETTQEFDVTAPRFELPADVVYSVYPERGQSVTHDTLPHIVFNDHMLPWERIGSFDAEEQQPPPPDAKYNRVPWLACLVFTPEELQIGQEEIEGIFGPTSIRGTVKQTESLAVQVPVSDMLKLKDGTSRVAFTDTSQATRPDTSIIFPTAVLFNALFSDYDENTTSKASDGKPNLSRHRFLSHWMRMNTIGMANADSDETTNREFSVLIANRIGPLVGDQPCQVVVHVVSLENLESLKPFPLPTNLDNGSPPRPVRVGLVSLYSWSYTCLPPNSLNVEDAFRQLRDNTTMLQPVLPAEPTSDPLHARLIKRLQDGYTMVRYMPPTGEVTAALTRGALTPNIVPADLGMDMQSNSGSNLQILDKELGMMDLTYSTAWSLGRTLALADRAYTIALTRVRNQIMKPATDKARRQMVQATSRTHYTKVDLARAIESFVDNTVAASHSTDDTRWIQPRELCPLDLSYGAIAPFFESALENKAHEVSASLEPNPDDWTLEYAPPYDEFNEPASPDWMIVFRFVMDLYYLVNVPSHYLLTDSSLLPTESLRFFFIDQHWIDALIDGALSLGNHGGPDHGPDAEADDPVRRSIKKTFNRFFHEPLCLGRKPAIPRFGFYLRSAVVAQFPDLKVTIDQEEKTSDGGLRLLRHDIIDKDTMIAFFNDEPLKERDVLRFEIPAHQQYFTAGNITATQLNLQYKRQYTVEGAKDPNRKHPVAKLHWPRNGKGTRVYEPNEEKKDIRKRSPFFIWGTTPDANDVRLLLVERLAEDVWKTVDAEMKDIKPGTWFTEAMATSAMTGYQLTSPSWQLQIGKISVITAATAEIGRISGALTYHKAPESAAPPSTIQTIPARIPCKLPEIYSKRTDRQRGPTPHLANAARIHKTPYPFPPSYPSAVKPQVRIKEAAVAATASKRPASWEFVTTSASTPATPTLSDTDTDSDFEDLALPFPRRNPDRLNPNVVVGAGEFDYRITSTLAPEKSEVPLIPSRQDLVFSVVYVGGGRDFALTGLVISIPVQKPHEANLLDKTDFFGRGIVRAKMVSNLRFNVRASYSELDNSLLLTLVPRSRAGRIDGVAMSGWAGRYPSGYTEPEGEEKETNIVERTELSVALYGVKVVQYEEDTNVDVEFKPQFKTVEPNPKTVPVRLVRPKTKKY